MPQEQKDTTTIEIEPLVERLNKEKQVAFRFRSRRHSQWNENYELYRDFVETNRLDQRQSINYPLMKETLDTVLSNIDDPPSVTFKILERGEGAEKKEMLVNQMWAMTYDQKGFEDLDILDKKNVLLTGRTFKKLNFMKKEFTAEVLDTFDVLVDPKVHPRNLESASYIIHTNIFKPLREVLASKKYIQSGVQKLKKYFQEEGIVESKRTREEVEAKQERLAALGVDNFDEFGASDTIVRLDEHYTRLWDKNKKEFVRYVVVVANESVVLFKKPLKNVIGIEEYPFETWADNLEISDFWSDGKADSIRTLNKVLNIWVSQLLENRTLRNYGMHWFDSTDPNFTPQQYEPKPFGMYPVPGKPQDKIQQVDIGDFSESLDEMQFIISAAEKVSAATPIEKGTGEKNKTLGEIELLASKSQERTQGIAKRYSRSWKQFAEKWFKILDANTSLADVVTLYKESISGKMYEKRAKAVDWKSKAGYNVRVVLTSQEQAQNTKEMQRWLLVQERFPNNPKMQQLAEKKILELTGASDEEVREVTREGEQSPELPGGLTISPPKEST